MCMGLLPSTSTTIKSAMHDLKLGGDSAYHNRWRDPLGFCSSGRGSVRHQHNSFLGRLRLRLQRRPLDRRRHAAKVWPYTVSAFN